MVEVILFRGWKDRERGVGTRFLGGWNSGVKMEWDIMDDNRDCIMCELCVYVCVCRVEMRIVKDVIVDFKKI